MNEEQDFRTWLSKYGCGNYKGIGITPDSELVSYTYVISLIVVTFRRSTPYYFKEVEGSKAMVMKLLCILCNLTLGWWGLPWGPIYVVKETICNLINKNTVKWGDLMKEAK